MLTRGHPIKFWFSFIALIALLSACGGGGGGDGNDDRAGDDNTTPGQTQTWYADADGDGFGNVNASIEAETCPDGYCSDNTDCIDFNQAIHPGATEICGDGIDQDCSGSDLACDTVDTIAVFGTARFDSGFTFDE